MSEYKIYTKEEMIKVAKEEGFIFVETSNYDYFIISKNDIADFIVAEAQRCNHNVNIKMYIPNPDIEEPILTTFGYYLNKINPILREEIIDNLVKLQTGNKVVKDIKVFDNEIFEKMDIEEYGEKKGQRIQFDKFFSKYYPNLEHEEELE